MNIDEILKIGKIEPNDENKALISKLKPHIESWLQSDKFASFISGGGEQANSSLNSSLSTQSVAQKIPNNKALRYCDLPYPPLLDPDSINYASSDIKTCWALNIPLPPFYDICFVGSHGAGFMAISNLFKLCKVGSAGRDGESDSYFLYESLFSQLKELKEAKNNGQINAIMLYLCDFSLDGFNDKLFSLVGANNAILVVRDPISMLKSGCNLHSQSTNIDKSKKGFFDINDNGDEKLQKLKRIKKIQKYYKLDTDLDKALSELIVYRTGSGEDEYASTPSASASRHWICDIHQFYHDGLLLKALVRLESFELVQTSDFAGVNAFFTMQKLCKRLGIPSPSEEQKESFNKRISDFKGFLPAFVMLNPDAMEQKAGSQVLDTSKALLIEIESKYSPKGDKIIASGFDLPDGFELRLNSKEDKEKIKEPEIFAKLNEFLPRLVNGIIRQIELEKEKYISEEDVLSYLASDYETAKRFAGLMSMYLRPLMSCDEGRQIINSWSFYARFSKAFEEASKDDETCYRLVRKNNDKNYIFMRFNKSDERIK